MTVDLTGSVSLAGSPASVFSDGSYTPVRAPEFNQSASLLTLADAVDHVLMAFGINSSTSGRQARAAVYEAYRDLPDYHHWRYYKRRASINTIASQTTGTVEYDSSPRILTLTGATWPVTSRYMGVVIGTGVYKIQGRTSSTEVLLHPEQCPPGDIAAGTSYELFKSVYHLPAGYRQGGRLQPISESTWPTYRNPEGLLDYMVHNYSPSSQPDWYTIRQSEDFMGSMCVEFAPPPNTERTYDFYYSSSPRPFQLFSSSNEYTTGTISASGNAITGSGTAFTSSMAGCVIRTSSSASSPTGIYGRHNLDNPYDEQRVIQSVTSGTELYVDQAFTNTVSGAKYSICSPVDLDVYSMATLFLKMCEYTFARMTMRDDADLRKQRVIQQLRVAIAADNKRTTIGESDQVYYDSLADLNRGN